MERLNLLIFFWIFRKIFRLVSRNSNYQGFQKKVRSFRIAMNLAFILASLSLKEAEAITGSSKSSNLLTQERLISDQNGSVMEKNDELVILVKADGNPVFPSVTGSRPNNSPTRAFLGNGGNPPARPSTINSYQYRTPPKVVSAPLGAGGNPGGGGNGNGGDDRGGGSEDPNFEINPRIPKKDPLEKYFQKYSSQTTFGSKKKKSADQCELNENVERREIVIRIDDNDRLFKEAKKTFKDQTVRRDIDHLTNQLLLGNKNPGTHTKSLKGKGLKRVFEARGKSGARVYFKEKDNKIEILAVSTKENQDTVIAILKKLNY